MKLFYNVLISLILTSITVSFACAQDGWSRSGIDEGPTFWLEPVWGTQIDDKWRAGETLGNQEDGITTEFVEFSADGELLVTADGSGEAYVVSAADGTVENTFTYITDEEISQISDDSISSISGGFTKQMEVECAAFTPDGRFLVLGGNLNGVKIFDLTDNSLVRHIEVDQEVDGLMISPDGRFLAHGADYAAQVIDINSDFDIIQQVDYSEKGRGGGVINSIDFTSDGNFMVLGGNSGHVKLFRTNDWKEVGDGIIENATSIKSVRFSPDGSNIAAGYGGGEVTVWKTENMELVNQFSSWVYIEAVAWSSDGRYLLTGGRDDLGRVYVYRTNDWQMVGNPEVQADGSSVEYIDVYNDLVATAGEDAHLRLYRIKTKTSE